MAGVYKGFSIGGRITARDPADRNIITGLELSEISVVDRPANPEAVFDCWKRAASALKAAEYADPSDIDAAGPLAAPDKAQDPSPPCPDLFRAPTPSNSPAAARKDVDGRDKPGHGEMASGWSARLRALVVELCDILETLGAGSGEYAAMSGRRLAHPDAVAKREPPLADALAKFAGEIVPRLDALHERVEQIARTPLPPQTVARGLASVSKRDDAGLPAPAGDDIVAALARMSEEERTLTLIKAARATPIRPVIR
jgi:hypothetical protein